MPGPYAITFTQQAMRELVAIAAWWRDNRGASGSITAEVLRIGELLAGHPTLGAVVENARRPGVRRLYLAHVGYHLFYRLDERRSRVVVLTLRHERRGPRHV